MRNKLIRYFKLRKNLNNEMQIVLNKIKDDLKEGKYKVTSIAQKKVAFIQNNRTNNFIKKISNANYVEIPNMQQKIVHKLKRVTDFILIKRIKIKNNHKSYFNGEIIMLTRENQVKIFDLHNLQVKTYLSDVAFVKAFEDFKSFSDYFNMTYIKFDEENLSVIEELIDYKSFENWTKAEFNNLIKYIYTSHIKYAQSLNGKLKRTKKLEELIKDLKKVVKNNELITLIENQFKDEDLYELWPEVKVHGDFTTNNILLKDDLFYIIDWEDSKEYIFFYDILNMLFVNLLYQDDFTLLKRFFDGDFDFYFINWFQEYGKDYNPKKKMVYFTMFLCERITKFEVKKNSNTLNNKYTKYIYYLKKLKERY